MKMLSFLKLGTAAILKAGAISTRWPSHKLKKQETGNFLLAKYILLREGTPCTVHVCYGEEPLPFSKLGLIYT